MKSLSGTMPEGYERIEAGVDWVTWVEPRDGKTSLVEHLGERLLRIESAKGAKVKPMTMQGYRGEQCAGVAIGSRPDSVLLRLSGTTALGWWTHMRGFTGRPTRLDVQVSLQLVQSRREFGRAVLSRSTASRSPRTGRPPKLTKWSDNRGAYCGMVGARTARKYIRVYDKGIESGTQEAGKLWRIELEAKREMAHRLWEDLCKQTDVPRWCLGCCASACLSSGLSWPRGVSYAPVDMPRADGVRPPEVERTLRWFGQLVRPSVERLVQAIGPRAVVEALGLSSYVSVDPIFDNDP